MRNCDTSLLPEELSSIDPDNMIIGTVLAEKQNFPNKRIIVVSRDINMRIKCDSLELAVQDYTVGQVVQNSSLLHTGFTKHLVDDETVDRFYEGEDIFLEKEDVRLYSNQMVMLVSNANEKKTALARFVNYNSSLRKINDKAEIFFSKCRFL